MSTNINKTGTSLQQTSTEELTKLADKAGFTPSTPQGAKTVGGTPQQAAMARTPATKAARVEGQGEETLAQAERLSPESAKAVDAPGKLERMRTLGTLNTQVEGLVDSYIQQAAQQQAALQLNSTALGAVEEGRRAPLTDALSSYLGATTDVQKEQAVVKAGQAMGRPITQAELQGYFTSAPDALRSSVATLTPDAVKLRDIDLQGAGIDAVALAGDLGVTPDDVLNYSLPELKQAIEAVEKAEFSASTDASAEALNAVGNQAKALQGQRQGLAQSGQAAYDKQFQDLADRVEQADVVRVAGQEYTLDALLKDETLSDVVAKAALDGAALKRLEATEPELAAWVKQYQATLAELAADAGGVATGVINTQAEAAKLKEGVSPQLFETLFGKSPELMTAAELATLRSSAEGSALFSALNADGDLKARLERNPTTANLLKDKSADEIKSLIEATKKAESNSAIADMIDFTPGGVVTDEQKAFIDK